MISGYDVQVHYERHYVKYARFTPEPSAGNVCSGGNLPIRKWACDVRQHCPLQWRHNGHDGVSNHQPHDCWLNRLFRRGSKHQNSASLAFFLRGIHRWLMYSPHKGPAKRNIVPFDDVTMCSLGRPNKMISYRQYRHTYHKQKYAVTWYWDSL